MSFEQLLLFAFVAFVLFTRLVSRFARQAMPSEEAAAPSRRARARFELEAAPRREPDSVWRAPLVVVPEPIWRSPPPVKRSLPASPRTSAIPGARPTRARPVSGRGDLARSTRAVLRGGRPGLRTAVAVAVVLDHAPWKDPVVRRR